jgi:hypothetical protein
MNLWHAGSNTQIVGTPKQSSTFTVDNFVDNLPSPPPKPRLGALHGWIAEKLSNIKVLKINHLHHWGAVFRASRRAGQYWRGCGVVGLRQASFCR